MKEYTVYFVIKKDGHGYLQQETVKAKSQKEAIKAVKQIVRKRTNRNAFNATCHKPVITKTGCLFNEVTYTGYSDTFHMLW